MHHTQQSVPRFATGRPVSSAVHVFFRHHASPILTVERILSRACPIMKTMSMPLFIVSFAGSGVLGQTPHTCQLPLHPNVRISGNDITPERNAR